MLVPLLLALLCAPAFGGSLRNPVVLVLVERLTWEEVRETPSLGRIFDESAVADLSTAQGTAQDASRMSPRMSYVLLGAGSRADASLLPRELPQEAGEVSGIFGGSLSSIEPGALGETLAENSVETAAVGERAELVVMDVEGQVPQTYRGSAPTERLEAALAEEAEFVVVEADSPEEAGRIASVAKEAGAVVAVASPTSPADSANLTPFALTGAGEGLLYSPTTRTPGLISSSDVAPTFLARLGIEPPPEMQGRAAEVRPGSVATAVRLEDRLSFVAEDRFAVWLLVGVAMLVGVPLAVLWRKRAGLIQALLFLAALPTGALVVASVPITTAPIAALLTLLVAGALVGVVRRLTGSTVAGISGVYLVVSALILADTTSGGTLMKFSTLGYNPAYGTRFYGIGNEYAAFLAGSLTTGIGAFAYGRRLPLVPALAIGTITILALGLPTMGADVGGSLALGFGFGATVGLIRGAGLRGLVLWSGGGLFLAAALFLLSGRLFAGVSHGSRAAGGETSLPEIIARKLLLSLELLMSPLLLAVFVLSVALIFSGWRRVRGTALGAGLLGATITALASGALNDSGILAAIYVLAYPAVAALIVLIKKRRELHSEHQKV